MVRLTQPLGARLDDGAAEATRRNTDQRIGELQALPAAEMTIIRDLTVQAPGNVVVAHKLGRAPQFVTVSAIRFRDPDAPNLAPGTVYDRPTVTFGSTSPIDRTQVVKLAFVGFAVAGTVDLTFDLVVM